MIPNKVKKMLSNSSFNIANENGPSPLAEATRGVSIDALSSFQYAGLVEGSVTRIRIDECSQLIGER